MDNRDTIRRRVIDRAVDLFNKDNPNGGGLFTTAHYGQAMKAEFRTSGPTLDGETCAGHLLGMGDLVEKAGGNLWRRRARQGGLARTAEATSVQAEILANKQIFPSGTGSERVLEIGSRIEAGVLRILADGAAGKLSAFGTKIHWWSAETMAPWFRKYETEDLIPYDDLLEVLLDLAFRAMEADGRVVAMRDMVVGDRGTWFGLAAKRSKDDSRGSKNGFGKLKWMDFGTGQ